MTIIVSKPEPHVAVITLNRPEAANALNTALARELAAAFTSLEARIILLTGNGKNFCAGADLKERQGMSEAQWHSQHEALRAARDAILQRPVPIIAAVNGAAYGGGLELALACDFIYASETARFALTETTLGIMPGLGGGQTLSRAVGTRRAKELIFSGKVFSAQEALAWGMVNHISNNVLEDALATARIIAANAPLSIKAVKASINEGVALPLASALEKELKYYNTLLSASDRHEGINAFNEKRKPVFKGE